MKKYLSICLMPMLTLMSLAKPVHSQIPQSKHFSIIKLDNGVYAAIAKTEGHAICNAGIVDLGDGTVIFDPFMSPEAAKDLKKISYALTGHPVKYVVNSHYHMDHVGGNQVFEQAKIISTERTRALMEQWHTKEVGQAKSSAPGILANLQKADTAGMSTFGKTENKLWIAYYESLVACADSLKTVLPNVTFKDKYVIKGKLRNAELISLGAGHTESDLFLYLPEDSIAFLGDILFVNTHPWMGDGDDSSWAKCLDSIYQLNISKAVPGHGPIGTRSDAITLKSYFQHIRSTAATCKVNDVLPESYNGLIIGKPFDEWFLSVFFKPNVITLYHKLYDPPTKK